MTAGQLPYHDFCLTLLGDGSGATAATGQAGVCQLLGAASTLSHVAHVLLPQASKVCFMPSHASCNTGGACLTVSSRDLRGTRNACCYKLVQCP